MIELSNQVGFLFFGSVKMKSIQVFDPAMCCNTGVCGVDVDQQLVAFSADVDWAKTQGVKIERFNLSRQPMAFVENIVVKAFLERSGQAALPLILLNGEIALAGRYPNRQEIALWVDAHAAPLNAEMPKETSCCSGGKCC
jgi:hypothetical protein